MSTQAQKSSHGHLGNEVLFPMAVQGDAAAEAILEERGNVLTDDVPKRLRKTRVSKYRDVYGMEHELVEVVENGKMQMRTVDGVSITGNVVPFA